MQPLCQGLGWDYKVLDLWLWEVLPAAAFLMALLGCIAAAVRCFRKGGSLLGVRCLTVLNCLTLGICILMILCIIGLLFYRQIAAV